MLTNSLRQATRSRIASFRCHPQEIRRQPGTATPWGAKYIRHLQPPGQGVVEATAGNREGGKLADT
jgi:hypothetical protein